MKITQSIFMSILALSTLVSCQKEKTETVEKTNSLKQINSEVSTFEVVSVIVSSPINEKYIGTFGGKSIELVKTEDSVLSFLVPDIESGQFELSCELGNLTYTVTKTAEIDPDQKWNLMVINFDYEVGKMVANSPEESAEIDSLKKFRNELVDLLSGMSTEERRSTFMIYEANKAEIQSFVNSTNQIFDGPSSLKRGQSSCPSYSYDAFYDCSGENIGLACDQLRSGLTRILKVAGAGWALLEVSSSLSFMGPFALGLSATGAALTVGAAGYILIFEIAPAVRVLKSNLGAYISSKWILVKDMFGDVTTEFKNQVSTAMNIKARFRTINSNDLDINQGSSLFIKAYSSLNSKWEKFKRLFGGLPEYFSSEENTTIETGEIQVSNISNSNVQYLGNSGQSLAFATSASTDQTFSYDLKVTKEGFERTQRLSGKVFATIDSTELYKASAVGIYNVTDFVGNGPNSQLTCELKAGGSAVYTLDNDPSWPNGTKFYENWQVQKVNGKYFITTSFTNPGHLINEAKALDYPISQFVYRHTYVK